MLRADYGDEAASGDLWVTCDKAWGMEVMVGRTRGHTSPLFMPLYFLITLSLLFFLPSAFFVGFFSVENFSSRILKHSWMSLHFWKKNKKQQHMKANKVINFPQHRAGIVSTQRCSDSLWMDSSDDLHPAASSNYANERILFVRCKYVGDEIMQGDTGENYTLWLLCPRVLGELFMKVLTEEEQVQQGAFLWGATTADSQVGLGLVLRPLDFNDGPVVSLCEPTA